MDHSTHPRSDVPDDGGKRDRRIHAALIGFLLIAGYFLATEHRAHVVQYLPLLLLLLCPVLHLLHHHDGGRRQDTHAEHDHG